MTRRRFIADEVSNNRAALVGEHAEHLARVLRARVGQEFDIAIGHGVRRGKITSLTKARIEFDLGEEVLSAAVADITLLLAVFKFDRMEWAIEKCTELGVARIVPVIAQRTDPHLATASAKRVERWQRIALQASEQSRRAVPPQIADPIRLSETLTVPGARRIVLAESERQHLLTDVLQNDSSGDVLNMAVGPEGGWTEGELQSFQKSGWISASLGNTILRAETAAIAALAVATALM